MDSALTPMPNPLNPDFDCAACLTIPRIYHGFGIDGNAESMKPGFGLNAIISHFLFVCRYQHVLSITRIYHGFGIDVNAESMKPGFGFNGTPSLLQFHYLPCQRLTLLISIFLSR
jgi:hypothetical protein